MQKLMMPALVLTLGTGVLIGIYTVIMLGIGKVLPGQGLGAQLTVGGNKQYANIGQQFTLPQYFQGRPSAVDYNAAGSGASNKGPNNPEYLAEVQKRIHALVLENPEMKNVKIPVDLITASGSGLDPHLSVPAAEFQLNRIAKARKMTVDNVRNIIEKNVKEENFLFFAPQKVNVLKLNAALDAAQSSKNL